MSQFKWISHLDAMAALKCSRLHLANMREDGSIEARKVDNSYEYLLQSLPADAQAEYAIQYRTTTPAGDSELYASAPDYARRKADKYLQIIQAAGDIRGMKLKQFVCLWNTNHPDNRTSYARIVDARNRYRLNGVAALLGQWGKREGKTSVPDILFPYYKSLYLSDGRPSSVLCWKMTLGYAAQKGIPAAQVPSHSAFHRRLTKEIPEQAVYTAREGEKAANRKYGYYIKRHYDNMVSGECWISDHAQVDIACSYIDGGKTKVGFPWITTWRDFKSGLWVGWDLHMESPNSDHIFISFYRGALKHGIPKYLYLDNGKDYRVRDFAGGRKHYRLEVDESRATSLTAALGITTIFAWPYNAQAKSIERDFLRQKEWFSKNAPGFRGGNVVEKPETLNATIAAGRILSIDEIRPILDDFIDNIAMQTPISSGYRKGKSPEQIWNEDYSIAIEQQKVRFVSRKALMLFCTRVSGILTIGRRGIVDSQLGINYYAPWMEGQKGRKIYLRRDINAYQEAWVFDAATDCYIDNAQYIPDVDALALTDIAKAQLQREIAIKRNAKKLIRQLAAPDFEIPFDKKIEALKTGTRILNDLRGYQQEKRDTSKVPLLLTDMDKVIKQHDIKQKEGLFDIKALAENIKKGEVRRRNLRIFDSDPIEDVVNQ